MTRSMLAFGCAILLAAPGTDARADNPTPEQIIDKAIKAHGGEEKLRGLSGFTYKSRTVYEKGPTWSYDYAVVPPSRYRRVVKAGAEAKTSSVEVIDGDRGWIQSGGETTSFPPPLLDNMKKFTIPYQGPLWVLRVRDRQKNPQCQFSAVGEITIDGRPAVGVRMKLRDGPQETWYFDKETGLLLKEESTTRRFESEDNTYTAISGDYKTFDGFPMACKVAAYQDGKLTWTREVSDFKVGTPDPSLFAKP